MAKRYQAPRGTNDLTPTVRAKEPEFEIGRWQFVEGVWADLVTQYGYEEIRTPIFEDIELFLRSSGETSDVVSKEMYDFFDKGDRHIALKPEGTAPVMRAYLEHGLGAAGSPTRLWYETHSFRYGRPGKGRYRQLHQFGVELIGSSSPNADAEVIEVAVKFFERVGLGGLKVMVNSIGRGATRSAYRDVILKQVSGWMADQSLDAREKAEKNPLRLLDTKDDDLKGVLVGLPSILEYLEYESRVHFEALQGALAEAGVEFVVTDSVVRGLDYYTDTVFEVVGDALGDGLSLCGGGRYDNLISQIGGPDTPSVGFGAGVERTVLAMIAGGVNPESEKPAAFIVAATEDAWPTVRSLVRALRDEGFDVVWDVDQRKLKQQFKAADRSGAALAVVIGTDEIASGTVKVKALRDGGEEWSVSREGLTACLAEY